MDGLLSFSDVQLYLGAAALLVGSCAIFFMDAAYRFFTSGRFDPFFQTLATFVLLIVIQLLVTIAALSIAFNNSVTQEHSSHTGQREPRRKQSPFHLQHHCPRG